MHFSLLADGGARGGEAGKDLRRQLPLGSKQRRPVNVRLEAIRENSFDLGENPLGGFCKGSIRPTGDDACTQHKGFDLLGREHHGRQIEPAVKRIADTRLTLNRYARESKILDIAIDRPLRYLEFLGQPRSSRHSPVTE